MEREMAKIDDDGQRQNAVLKFIFKSCLTTLLILGLILVIGYYPEATKDLGPTFGEDTVTNVFFGVVIGILMAIVIIQLYARFLRPRRIEKDINQHVKKTLAELSKAKKI
jgi:hypothetical protein